MTKKSTLVVFRADASVQIGTGHIMRCLTLADELTRQGHECRFICREHEGHLGELISSKGYELTMLRADCGTKLDSLGNGNTTYADWLGASWQQDAEQAVEALTPLSADWLIVDHYALNAGWEQKVAKAVGRIMVIDDLADRNHECALLLNQNLGRNASDYDTLVPQDCQRLIGPEYALLRPEFAELRERSLKRRARPELKRILIFLGGVDRTNVTGQVLYALAETALPKDTHLDIIMGSAAPYLNEVRQQAARLPFKATVSVNVSDMAERMCLADLAIGGVGSTSWERCCLGLPAFLVVLADNQRPAANALSASGAAIIADDRASVSVELGDLVNLADRARVLAGMAQLGGEMIDGLGCTRVANELIRRN
jgi:UDP-2,4-diacetamido-2,4,6-trideoxy-beta-L-altropyranose hydrolase